MLSTGGKIKKLSDVYIINEGSYQEFIIYKIYENIVIIKQHWNHLHTVLDSPYAVECSDY